MNTTVIAPPADPTAPYSTDSLDAKNLLQQVALASFIAIPFAALVLAIPVLWGRGLGWPDVVIAIGMYVFTGHGITVGFHRFFTHKAFRAKRWIQG